MKFIHFIDNQHLGMKKKPKGKRILKIDSKVLPPSCKFYIKVIIEATHCVNENVCFKVKSLENEFLKTTVIVSNKLKQLIYECKCSPHAQAKFANTLAFLIT
jgi:hypothetical protein